MHRILWRKIWVGKSKGHYRLNQLDRNKQFKQFNSVYVDCVKLGVENS